MYVRASNFKSENAISTTYGMIMMCNETKKARENPHREDGRQSPVISCRQCVGKKNKKKGKGRARDRVKRGKLDKEAYTSHPAPTSLEHS